MRDKDTTHIHLSSNYSGACEQVPLTNENLLELTNADRFMLDGQTLFALKYRVLPWLQNRQGLDDLIAIY
jgi:hypothetical protein